MSGAEVTFAVLLAAPGERFVSLRRALGRGGAARVPAGVRRQLASKGSQPREDLPA
jgi:hypothetical protein